MWSWSSLFKCENLGRKIYLKFFSLCMDPPVRIVVNGPEEGGSISKQDGGNNEEDEEVPRRSSLHDRESAPAKDRRKKVIRFADSLGLDLVDVKKYNKFALPRIPRSVLNLQQGIYGWYWESCFPEEKESHVLLSQLKKNKIVLERCSVAATSWELYGQVITSKTISTLDKQVLIRYSYDEWETVQEIQCYPHCKPEPVAHSSDVLGDVFIFTIPLFEATGIKFACKCLLEGRDTVYWDDNESQSYIYEWRRTTAKKWRLVANSTKFLRRAVSFSRQSSAEEQSRLDEEEATLSPLNVPVLGGNDDEKLD